MTPSTQTPARIGARQANRARLREDLLDAAEELFADGGYYGVSVRDITERAGTRLAAVSDHFGGKENLLRDVLRRRVEPLNAERRRSLGELSESGSQRRRLACVINAFTVPMLDHAGDAGWRNYFRLIAQLSNSRVPALKLVADEYNTIATVFIDRLRQIFPDAGEPVYHEAYLHMVAATMHTFADTARLDRITQGRGSTHDINERHRVLTEFVAGGITRLVGRG
ncbi:TetR/AcrR family transcriptional regulator [Mycobacterium sp. D16R24]|uniref:TetR/AcrR family transcriptional regulator n=1 Tax=Mycobacterium sp. D16R24 TaxID=1855656 RepID=UPI001590F16B|nr:TetR/AcrR family transcriptional regulator [Mycobacterium sp. D16R24]